MIARIFRCIVGVSKLVRTLEENRFGAVSLVLLTFLGTLWFGLYFVLKLYS